MHYKINATNCGQCPSTADTNSVTCNIPNNVSFEQICVLTVEAVVCGNISGIPSEPYNCCSKSAHCVCNERFVKLILYLQQLLFFTYFSAKCSQD